jgi:hypothetical protein
MEGSTFQITKNFLVALTGISKNELHIHFGLIIMLCYSIFFHKRLGSFGPLITVFIFAFIGEWIDFCDDLIYHGYWRWLSSIHDICNTIFWPCIFFLLFRFRAKWLSISESS